MVAAEKHRPCAALEAAIGSFAGADGQGFDFRGRRQPCAGIDIAEVRHGIAEPGQAFAEAGGAQIVRAERGAAAGRAGIGRHADQVDAIAGGRSAGASVVEHLGVLDGDVAAM